MFKVGIIVASDKGFKGEREDLSGKKIKEIIEERGFIFEHLIILPDELELLRDEMVRLCDNKAVDLILTTGGTGFSKRDCTPEATIQACERLAPGIAEAMRMSSLSITKRAMLSRAVSGIRKDTLIVNLPGSPKAVEENLLYIIDDIKHGIEILQGKTSECARK